MHMNFTAVIGPKMMQSLVSVKKNPSPEGKSKVKYKAAMKTEELSTYYLFRAPKVSELYIQSVRL